MFYLFYSTRVLVTLTTEVGKLISKLHGCKPEGNIDLVRGIRVANVIRTKPPLSIRNIEFLIKFNFTIIIACTQASSEQEPQAKNHSIHSQSSLSGPRRAD